MPTDEVDAYLAGVPVDARRALEELRGQIREIAPDTTETISYQMPTFKYRGKALVGFAAFKGHCSLFPYSTGVMRTLATELADFDTSGKGATIRFTVNEPLPRSLVKKVVTTRMKEIDARA